MRNWRAHVRLPFRPRKFEELGWSGFFNLLLGWRDPGPEIIELDTVEHRGRLCDLTVVHFKQPKIGVCIGLTVARRSLGVKEDYHNVSIGAHLAYGWLETHAHPCVEGLDYLAQ